MEESPAIVRLNLQHYEAMLKQDIDDEKRKQIEQLIREAKAKLNGATERKPAQDR